MKQFCRQKSSSGVAEKRIIRLYRVAPLPSAAVASVQASLMKTIKSNSSHASSLSLARSKRPLRRPGSSAPYKLVYLIGNNAAEGENYIKQEKMR